MKSKIIKYSPFTIAGIYFILAALWISYSDLALYSLVHETVKLHLFQSLKGYLFVFVTALLLFFMLRKLIEIVRQEAVQGEYRFRVLAQNTSAGIFMHSEKFIFTNKAMLDIIGYSSKEIQNMTITDIVSDEFKSLVSERCNALLSGSKLSCNDEVRIVRGDGLERWMNIYATIVEYKDSSVMLGTVSDITESRAVQQSLIKSEQRYRLLFENNPLPMWLYDVNSLAFLEVNESAVKRYGYSREEFLNMTIKDIRPAEDVERLLNNVNRVSGGVDEAGVWRHTKKDGATIFVDIQSYAFEIGGRLVELVQSSDITATVEAQDQLLRINAELENKIKERTKALSEANERLMELDRLKTLFVSSMTHELRTPLNAVLGFSSLLDDGVYGDMSEDQKGAVSKVLKGGQQLLDLVNDAIDVTKIEAGQMEQQISDFDLYELFTEISLHFKEAAAEKNITLNLDPIHKLMHSDRRRIYQALLNLVDNAVKFTDHGSITLSASVVGEGSDDEKILIAVKDTGVGIKDQDMHELFVPFSKLGMVERRMSHGTGLGLYLTHKIVEDALNGEMSVESEFGKGSTFMIMLPVKL
ncbi:MAG: PAS domain S-box protein [Nitrospirae bacterium]|nr:PAS domain S-box protein [Nitrospirota bacterium]